MEATIYKSTGVWYQAKTMDGQTWNARAKGKFKTHDISSTNPLAVGDVVDLEVENEGESSAIITAIHDRRNYITRQSPHNKRYHHIVASNLDQLLLIATLREPRTSQGFIDRFLVAAEMYGVPARLVFNKADVYRAKEMEHFAAWSDMYSGIGYPVLLTSVKEGTGMDTIRDVLKNKITLLSGHSGVGKSSFVNALFPGMQLRTGEVSDWSGKGMHTTTFAEMFDLPGGGRVIDTPGVREFGLIDVTRQELSHYFPEMRVVLGDCQFNNCLHLEEPGCAVKAGVIRGTITEDRYVSYVNLLESLQEKLY
ncbi:ribosome small subunit-dependent GTPase A [Dinghuibacter silviterrae]|uniref:Small ribosomal subunit biogenesis GTPase RsgA n=1 Tax=Dinghuibacter silviterrae TaxID=1539049 RepID=A0A4R8DN57_9BACT|nr:ribosome small subunit-dependent GTPase A [Dinghuibacter silviterrae]TDW99459.1 ribosome biogenesis GTPase [Dinghuibacter silviterrae]